MRNPRALRPIFSSLLAVVALLTIPLSSRAAPEVNDQTISDAVEDQLVLDPGVFAATIDVVTVTGVVTLSGTTSNLLAKERAAKVAMMVKGVRSVVNEIEVRPAPLRSDKAIAEDVRAALFDDPVADAYELVTTVDDGVVTLTGTVQSWQERRLAERVAKGVRGVTGVQNQIAVSHVQERPDAEIQAEVEQALRWDVLVDAGLVDVQVKDGVVTLTGTVGSASEKWAARSLAWVAGVDAVDTAGLEVARWARDDDLRQNKYPVKSDAEIRQAVVAALLRDPRVNSLAVIAEVAAGTVTLRGTVDNLRARRAAASDARNTVGVVSVRNRLKVRPADLRTDPEIAGKVRDALARNHYLEPYEVLVDVRGGVAYLSGTVDTFFEKRQADLAAANVDGVVSVVNNIIVLRNDVYSYDPYLDRDWYGDYLYQVWPRRTDLADVEIERNIANELFWSPFVDADQVTVVVDDGVVTLTGTVDTWSERQAATDNAYEGGAVWVDNNLQVRY